MSLGDLLSNSFLVSVGVSLLLLTIASFFFLQKMNEQNHKISSMLGLVSTMADELNILKRMVPIGGSMPFSKDGDIRNIQTTQSDLLNGAGAVREDDNSLISVSDDSEEGSEDESEDGSEEENDDESEDGSEEDEEELQDSHEINDVKVINMGSENAEEIKATDDIQSFDIDEEDDEEDDDDDDDDDDDESDAIDLANEIDIEEITAEPVLDNGEVKLNDQLLMAIDPVADLETSTKEVPFPVIDFKKMTLPKLKEYVKENGLIEQPNKMKKGEIIEFLENM